MYRTKKKGKKGKKKLLSSRNAVVNPQPITSTTV